MLQSSQQDNNMPSKGNLMICNLNNYVIFHTVAKTENISKAASQLYISQPAISKSISKLEAELGTELFSRSSRGVYSGSVVKTKN